jgi:hypothetical protein
MKADPQVEFAQREIRFYLGNRMMKAMLQVSTYKEEYTGQAIERYCIRASIS